MVHRRAFLLLIVASGCYSPGLSSPGFFCHVDDNPACPDGQQCVPNTLGSTQGRCMSKNGRPSGNVDMAMSSNEDLASNNPIDMARMMTSHDLAMSSGLTGCNGLITCVNNCPTTSTTCPMTCQNNTTSNGNALFTALINCLVAACPNAIPGDVCFDPNAAACTACFSSAQSPGPPTGACYSQLSQCHNDLP